MAKPNPEVKQFNNELELARKTLKQWSDLRAPLRERIRDTLAVLTFISKFQPETRFSALCLLAALLQHSKLGRSLLNCEIVQNASDDPLIVCRPIQSLGFNRQQLAVAHAISQSKEQSTLILNAHLDSLLMKRELSRPIDSYTTPAFSALFDKFWSDKFTVVSNAAFNGMCDHAHPTAEVPQQQVTVSNIVKGFTRGLSQVIASTGLANMLSRRFNLYQFSAVDIYVAVTDSKNGVDVYCLQVLEGDKFQVQYVANYIRSMAMNPDADIFDPVKLPLECDDEDEEVDEEDDEDDIERNIDDIIYNLHPEEMPACSHSLDNVRVEYDGFPVFIDFEMVDLKEATGNMFDKAANGMMIGFSVVLTERCLSQNLPDERQQFEFAAAVLELCNFNEPQAVKPARANQTKAKKTESRTSMINVLAREAIKSRSELKNMSYDALWKLYREYKSGTLDF